MKIAPSTPTLSIAATISSPVTWSGQFGTLCQGRFGVFASYTCTWESMIVIGDSSSVPCEFGYPGRFVSRGPASWTVILA